MIPARDFLMPSDDQFNKIDESANMTLDIHELLDYLDIKDTAFSRKGFSIFVRFFLRDHSYCRLTLMYTTLTSLPLSARITHSAPFPSLSPTGRRRKWRHQLPGVCPVFVELLQLHGRLARHTAFDLYDTDASGRIETAEIENMLKEVYGREGYEKNQRGEADGADQQPGLL